MNATLLIRTIFALLSVAVPMMIMMHLPADSAFYLAPAQSTFDLWHGLMVVSSLMLTLVVAGRLLRL